MVDPVYTGKAFSGLLDYIRSGKISKGSKVAFLHTGGTGALFAGEVDSLVQPDQALPDKIWK